MRPLFRPEAVAAQRQQWLGAARVSLPRGLPWLVLAALLGAGLVLLLLQQAPQARTLRAPGVVVDAARVRLAVAPERVAAFEPGLTARLHFEALPSRAGGQARATVTAASRVPEPDGAYAVWLRVDESDTALVAGMRLEAVLQRPQRPPGA